MKMWKSLPVVGLLLGAVVLNVQKVSAGMGWQTAFDVKYTHWDGGPHYGAYFGGSYGTNQY